VPGIRWKAAQVGQRGSYPDQLAFRGHLSNLYRFQNNRN
jgi:hypothetical protein